MGAADSAIEESFSNGLLEYPHYTRPRDYRGRTVPEILLGGNHAEIDRWRREQARVRTIDRRGVLLQKTKGNRPLTTPTDNHPAHEEYPEPPGKPGEPDRAERMG